MPAVRASTRVGAVLGWPVEHSRSPVLHNAAFAACGIDAVFVGLAVAPSDLATAVRGLAAVGCLGASVTVPHKEAVAALCARVTAPADRVGAVNCLAFEHGAIVGHNTDAGGFVDALDEAGLAPADRRAVVLGAGGAARAVVAGLGAAGADVTVVARHPEAATWIAARPWGELADLCARADLLIDCTSAGLDPSADRALADRVAIDRLPGNAAVVTLVYHRRTELCARAQARGLVVLDGRGMLVHQGARAFAIWTGRAAPIAAMRAALDDDLA